MDTNELDDILQRDLPLRACFTVTRRRKGGWYVRVRVPPDFDTRVPLADAPITGLTIALSAWQKHNGQS